AELRAGWFSSGQEGGVGWLSWLVAYADVLQRRVGAVLRRRLAPELSQAWRAGVRRIGSFGPAATPSARSSRPEAARQVGDHDLPGRGPSHLDTYDMKPDAPSEF